MATSARILLADDEEDFLRYAAALFRKAGYECDCAADAPAALDRLSRRRYDAVISDIRMPGNDGLRLVREAARMQAGVPVILVTAYPSMETAVSAVELPVSAYVEKPVEFRDLLSKVDGAILASRRHSRAAGVAPDEDGRTGWFVDVLSMIAVELRASKRAFKSRRLGRLRERVEKIVSQLKTET